MESASPTGDSATRSARPIVSIPRPREWRAAAPGSFDYLEGMDQPTLVVNGSNDIVVATINSCLLQQNTGEHREPALGDLDADVLEVVLARALHADQIVAVGQRAAQATACPSSWPCSSCLHLLDGAAFAVSVGLAWLDLTSFEQYACSPSPARSRQQSPVYLIGPGHAARPVRRTVRRGTGHPDVFVVGEQMLDVATTLSAGAGVGTHRS
jgi:hypothetical protein